MSCSKVLILFLSVLTVAGAATAQGDLPDIYASNIEELEGTLSQIGRIRLSDNASDLLFEAYDLAFEDIVLGPGCRTEVPPNGGDALVTVCSTYIYACDPTSGLIIRFDPAQVDGTIGMADVDFVYQAGGGPPPPSGNLLDPQCGWFTNSGDLLFTDTNMGGTWLCSGIGHEVSELGSGASGDPLCKWVDNPDVVGSLVKLPAMDGGGEPYGQGITQAANGDALVVNSDSQGRILRYKMDGPTGVFVIQPPEPIPGDDGPVLLSNPLGIARLSTGDIFVTTDVEYTSPSGSVSTVTGYKRFTPFRETPDSPKQWLETCSGVVDVCEGPMEAFFLEASADDTVYVGANFGGCSPRLMAITTDDSPQGYGCQVTPVFPTGGSTQNWYPYTLQGIAVAPSGTGTDPDVEGNDYVFSFNDHVYELSVPDECVPQVEAIETPAWCLQNLIDNNVFYDPDGDGDPVADFDAEPVFYLGEKAFGISYDLSEGEGSEGCDPGDGESIRHAVSAYTELLTNPRLIRCDIDGDVCDATQNDVCEVVDLTSFFPYDGNLPGDGRIGGRTSTFSQYFLVDSGPDGYDPLNPVIPADFCRFWPPFWNIQDPDQSCLPTFFAGFPIKIRFRIAKDGESCWWGDWETDKEILLSVARIRDADGNPVFQAMDLQCLNADCSEQAIFNQPVWRWKPYNLRFSTCGWPEGVYQASAMALDGSIVPQVDHFRIVTW